MVNKYFLPDDYEPNFEPRYEDCSLEKDKVYQPDVYKDAWERAGRQGCVIDLGCGRAEKLLALGAAHTIGVEFGANVQWLITRYPSRRWWDLDLERIYPDSIPYYVLLGSTIICADVIEHLVNPEPLLRCFAAWAAPAREIVITTPDRLATHPPGSPGRRRPLNRSHVREWAADEFRELLRSYGLDAKIRMTRTAADSQDRHTIEATIACSATI